MSATVTPAVPPYLYEVLWSLALYGPLTAAEIAEDHNRPTSVPEYLRWTPQQAANRMRGPQRLGLVERSADGFWSLTAFGREWLTLGGRPA